MAGDAAPAACENRRPAKVRVSWFDWALMGGLAVLLAIFPAWIPVLLYYL